MVLEYNIISMNNKKCLTGIRPTNALHIGNIFGSLDRMKQINGYDLFIMGADLHSTTEYKVFNVINTFKTFLAILGEQQNV